MKSYPLLPHNLYISKAEAVISHTSKVVLKILQSRLQKYVNRELPDVQDGFRKGRETVRGSTLIETAHPGQAP